MPAVGNVNPGRPAGVPNTPRKRKTAPIAVGGQPGSYHAPPSATPSSSGGSAPAPVPSSVTGAAPPTTSGVSAAEAAYQKQQNLLQNYVLHQATKQLVRDNLAISQPGQGLPAQITGLKPGVTPRQVGEDVKKAAARIRSHDTTFSDAGLGGIAKAQILSKNAQGKTVSFKGMNKLKQTARSGRLYARYSQNASITGRGHYDPTHYAVGSDAAAQAQQAAGQAPGYSPPESMIPGQVPGLRGGGPYKLRRSSVGTDPSGQESLTGNYPSDVQFALMLATAPVGEAGALTAAARTFEEGATTAARLGASGADVEKFAQSYTEARAAANVEAVGRTPITGLGKGIRGVRTAPKTLGAAVTRNFPKTTAALRGIGDTVPGARFAGSRIAKHPYLSGSTAIGAITHPDASTHDVAAAVNGLSHIDGRDLLNLGGKAAQVVTHTPKAIDWTFRALKDPEVRKQTLYGLKTIGFQAIEFPILAPTEIISKGPGAAANEFVGGYAHDISRRWTPVLSGSPNPTSNQGFEDFKKELQAPGAGGAAYMITELLPLIHAESVAGKAAVRAGAYGGEYAHLPGAKGITDYLTRERPNLRRGAGPEQVREQGPISKGIVGTLSQRTRDTLGTKLQQRIENRAGTPYRMGGNRGAKRPRPPIQLNPESRSPVTGDVIGETTPLTAHIPILKRAATYARHRGPGRVVSGQKAVRAQQQLGIDRPLIGLTRPYAKKGSAVGYSTSLGPATSPEALVATLLDRRKQLPGGSPEITQINDLIAEVQKNPGIVAKLAKDVPEIVDLQKQAEAASGLIHPDQATIRRLWDATEFAMKRPESGLPSFEEAVGHTPHARARAMFSDAVTRYRAARAERKRTANAARSASGRKWRSQTPHARAEGESAVRSGQVDRAILKKDTEYRKANNRYIRATHELSAARKAVRNVDSAPSLHTDAEAQAALERLDRAEGAVEQANANLDAAKRSVAARARQATSDLAGGRGLKRPEPPIPPEKPEGPLTKAERAAWKDDVAGYAAEVEDYKAQLEAYQNQQRLARLTRSPTAPLRRLERTGGKVADATQREVTAQQAAKDARIAEQQAARAMRAARDAFNATKEPGRRDQLNRNPADDMPAYIRAVGEQRILEGLARLGHGEPGYFPARVRPGEENVIPQEARSGGMISFKPYKGDLARAGTREMAGFMLPKETSLLLNTSMRAKIMQRMESGFGLTLDDLRGGHVTTKSGVPENRLKPFDKVQELRDAGYDPQDWVMVNTKTWNSRVAEGMSSLVDDGKSTYGDIYQSATTDAVMELDTITPKTKGAGADTVLVPKDEMNVARDLLDMGPTAQRNFIWNRIKTFGTRWVLANPGWFAFQMLAATFLAGLANPKYVVRGAMRAAKIPTAASEFVKNATPLERDHFEANLGLPITGSPDFQYRAGALAAGINFMDRAKGTATWEKTFEGRNPLDWFFRGIPKFEHGIRQEMLYDQVRKEAYRRMGSNFRKIGAFYDGISKWSKETKPTLAQLESKMHEITADLPTMEKLQKNITQFMGDYETFSSAERSALQSNIMFYGFLRHSLMLAVYTLPVKHPGRLALMAAASKMVDNNQKAIITQQTRDYLTNLIHTQYGVSMQKAAAASAKLVGPGALIDTSQVPAELMGRFMFPNGNIIDTVRAAPLGNSILQAENPTALLGALSPTFQIPLSLLTGKNFFTGSDLQSTASQSGPLQPLQPEFWQVGAAEALNYISPLRLASTAVSKYPASERTAGSFPLPFIGGIPPFSLFGETPQHYAGSSSNRNFEYQRQLARRAEQVRVHGGMRTVESTLAPFVPHPQSMIAATVINAFDPTFGSITNAVKKKNARIEAMHAKKTAKGGSGVYGSSSVYGGSSVYGASSVYGSTSKADKKPNISDTGGYGFYNTIRHQLGTLLGKDFFKDASGPLAGAQKNTFASLLEKATGSQSGFSGADLRAEAQANKPAGYGQKLTSLEGPLKGKGAQNQPVFTKEGTPKLYKQAYNHYKRFATPGPYTTKLTTKEQAGFKRWQKTSGFAKSGLKVTKDYDYAGWWKATGGVTHNAQDQPVKWKPGLHFPDYYKTPYDTTFSSESKYATADNPLKWHGDTLVNTRTGQTMFAAEATQQNFTNIATSAGEHGHGKPQKLPPAASIKKLVKQIPSIGISHKVAPVALAAAQKYGIPASVIMGVMVQETGVTPGETSSKGAQGIGQIMPFNLKSQGGAYDVQIGTDGKAVKSQIAGIAHMLSDGKAANGGSLEAALNGYYGTSTPYSDQYGDSSYAQKVISHAQKYQALDKAGGNKGGPYVYPFTGDIQVGRTDMGIDPFGTGKIKAIGKAKVIGTPAEGAGAGWPQEQGTSGGAGITYKLLKGPLKGKKVYTYEGPAANTGLKKGDILKRGEVFAKSVAGPGGFETGFARGAGGSYQPINADTYSEGDVTEAGTQFAKFVAGLKPGATLGKLPSLGSLGGSSTTTTGAVSTTLASTGGSSAALPAGVSPATATNMQLSIGRSKTMSAAQKLRLIDTLTKPGGVAKMLGIPGAFTDQGSLTSDGAKTLASLSADRLRLLSTTAT